MTRKILISLSVLLFFGCQKKNETNNDTSNQKPTIETIKLAATYGNYFIYVTGKNITVNWGDGTSENAYTKTYTDLLLSHTIRVYQRDTIVIKGESITALNCSSNEIRGLDVSGNPSLEILNCRENFLNQLDLSKNSALKFVNCQSNTFSNSGLDSLFKTLPVNTTGIADSILFQMNPGAITCDPTIAIKRGWNANNSSFLDGKNELATFVCQNTDHAWLQVSGNNISVDWGDGKYETFSKLSWDRRLTHTFPKPGVYPVKLGGDNITYLYCGSNKAADLNITKLPNLTYPDCSGNYLYTLDVSKNTKLSCLICQDDLLGPIDLSNNKELTYLDCSSGSGYMINHFSALDFSANQLLKHLDCSRSGFSNLNVSKNTALTYIDCRYCYGFTTLNISNNVLLDTLYLEYTRLHSLDASHNPALKFLSCYYSELTSLNISNNPALQYIYVNNNNIKTIDATGCPSLVRLDCSYNGLTSLIVSENKTLEWLNCGSDELDTLSLLHSDNLKVLYCFDNHLTTLDLTNCIQLEVAHCGANNLSTTAMNNLFTSLYPKTPPASGTIFCLNNNPGSYDCDKTIATKKGWSPAY